MAIDPKIKEKANHIRTAVLGRDVREALASGLEVMSEDVEGIKENQQEVQETFQNLLDETTGKDVISAPEILNARRDTKGKTHSNLKERLDTEYDELSSQLAETRYEAEQARVSSDGTTYNTLKDRLDTEYSQISTKLDKTRKKFFYNSINNHKFRKPLLVLIDDDGRPQVWTQLKPVVEQEEVPIGIAVVTNRVGNTELSLTLEQMRELEKLGFYFLSHSHSHKHLAELTEEEIEFEVKTSHDWLRDNGFDTYNVGLVYPFGSVDERVEKITRRYFQCGVHANTDKLNSPPLNTYSLERIYYNLEDGTQQIDYCKQKIDESVENGNLLIIGTHCFYQGFDPNGLIEVIQYAKSKGVPIVTLEEALIQYGNILDIDTKYQNVRVGLDGSGNLKDYVASSRIAEDITANTPVQDIPPGTTVTYYYLNHPNVADFPANAGILETVKMSNTYAYQVFMAYRSRNAWRRYWDPVLNQWSDWISLKDYEASSRFANDIKANTPIQDIPLGTTVTYYFLGHPSVDGFPANAGILETIKMSNSHAYQIFSGYRSRNVWRRYWDPLNNQWSDWLKFINNNFDMTTTATHQLDWSGTLTVEKEVNGLVHLHGILTAGQALSPNQTIVTVPLAYSYNGFTPIQAYNHTQRKLVDFYMTNVGELRYLEGEIATGDSIRFNTVYRTLR